MFSPSEISSRGARAMKNRGDMFAGWSRSQLSRPPPRAPLPYSPAQMADAGPSHEQELASKIGAPIWPGLSPTCTRSLWATQTQADTIVCWSHLGQLTPKRQSHAAAQMTASSSSPRSSEQPAVCLPLPPRFTPRPCLLERVCRVVAHGSMRHGRLSRRRSADNIMQACKGFGTDDKALMASPARARAAAWPGDNVMTLSWGRRFKTPPPLAHRESSATAPRSS